MKYIWYALWVISLFAMLVAGNVFGLWLAQKGYI